MGYATLISDKVAMLLLIFHRFKVYFSVSSTSKMVVELSGFDPPSTSFYNEKNVHLKGF